MMIRLTANKEDLRRTVLTAVSWCCALDRARVVDLAASIIQAPGQQSIATDQRRRLASLSVVLLLVDS